MKFGTARQGKFKEPKAVPRKRPKLERHLEAAANRWMKDRGCLSRKMNGLGFRDWPDRLYLPPEDEDSGRKPIWVEFKKPDEGPTESQAKLHKTLLARGQKVHVIDNLEAFKGLIRMRWGIR